MARLPTLRRRRSRTDQALDLVKNAARVWTILKLGSTASRAAKGGAKAYGTAKTAKVAGRPVLKMLAVPAAALAGFALWRKLSSSSSSSSSADDATGFEQERPLGPVATPEAVSPPAPEAASGAQTDPPAGASNPPARPQSVDDDEPPVGPSPTFANEST
jgi:hypothetical protein